MTSAGVWHRRRLVLTAEMFLIAREDSNDVLDQIPLTSIMNVMLNKPNHSLFGQSFVADGNGSPYHHGNHGALHHKHEFVPDPPVIETGFNQKKSLEAKRNYFVVTTKPDGPNRGRT